jgi:hypothetical protein
MPERLKRCEGFGIKFDEKDEICTKCEDAMDCLRQLFENETRIRSGEKPTAIVPKVIKQPVMIMLPKDNLMSDKIKIEIYFDKEWLRKQFLGNSK